MSHWTARAACTGMNTELFFSEDPAVIKSAKRVCASCPVAWACLDDAQNTEQSKAYGIRAGLTGHERNLMRYPTAPELVARRRAKDVERKRLRASARRLLDDGLNIIQVAERLGVDKGTVSRWRSNFRAAA